MSHTHWDREWYKTAEAFRVHLLPLVEQVLARRQPFLLDGQAIILDDVLTWAPQLREPLAQALREGWLEAGPWYVLADNSLCGGEALVRNLMAGREALGALGASAPRVLYCPDTFGHPDAGPTLAAGFGLGLAMTWRGFGGRGWPAGDLVRWRNGAGDEVLMHHLPPAGYEYGAALPAEREGMSRRWAGLEDVLAPRSPFGRLLLLAGADHHAPHPDADAARERLREAVAPGTLVETGLHGYAEAQRTRAASHRLPSGRGELRASPSYVWTLGGTMGSRAHQKRENALLERLLVHEIEPLLALAQLDGHAVGADALRAAWRALLATHPHDTLCGCSIDEVALAMEERQRQVRGIAVELRTRALDAVPGRDVELPPVLAPPPLVTTNMVPRPRGGVIEATVDLPMARVPIGFGAATETPPTSVPARWAVVRDGRPCPMQRLGKTQVIVRDESSGRYPRTTCVERHQALLWVDDPLPPGGLERFEVALGTAPGRLSPPLHATGGVLDNGLIRVWWDRQQGLCCDGPHGRWTDLLSLETVGERGDLYTHAPIPGTTRHGKWHKAKVTATGPLRAELSCSGHVRIARRVVESATGVRTGHADSGITVAVRVQLDAGAPWFRVLVDGVSRAQDYRLRLLLRAGIAGHTHRADAAFCPVERANRPPAAMPGDVEVIPPAYPLHRWVSGTRDDEGRGLALISDGLGEYEVLPDGTIGVTLLRAVGELSRSGLPERPGHAGYPAAVPLAQCVGPFGAVFAVLPHGADHTGTRDRIERVTEDVLLPLRLNPMPRLHGARRHGPHLEGEGLRWLSSRALGEGPGMIVRCANVTHSVRRATLTLPGLSAAHRLRLDDTPIGALTTHGDRVAFEVPPGVVCSVELRVSR